jgi:hypothetical protein
MFVTEGQDVRPHDLRECSSSQFPVLSSQFSEGEPAASR